MLDDLKYIHSKDVQDALGIAEKQWQQLTHEFEIPDFKPKGIENIVFTGMGGSALAALMSRTWPGHSVPFEVVRGYNLPKYVNHKTLVIASSYSGNTEETLSALHEAESAGAQIAVLACGGKLLEEATAKKIPHIVLPTAAQPRFAALFSFKALVVILAATGFVHREAVEAELAKASEFVKSEIANWNPTVPRSKNPAKKLAYDLIGLSPVIYGGPLMAPAAYKWKISFNENAKNIAWWNEYPEFNHNEFMGWASHPIDKPYAVIDLKSNFEHERIQKRMALSAKLLSGRRPAPHVIEAKGDTLLEQLIYTIVFGDFVAIYMALLNGINPTPVELIEKFKAELAK